MSPGFGAIYGSIHMLGESALQWMRAVPRVGKWAHGLYCTSIVFALAVTAALIPARVDASIQTVRRQFQMRAARFAAHDAIVREVAVRLFERLSYMRPGPTRVVMDLGCGGGACQGMLLHQFPGARYLGIDLSEAMLAGGNHPLGWNKRLKNWLVGKDDAMRACASGERLPLPDGSIDMVFSNLMLHWHPAPHEVIVEIGRVLRTGGLVLFSSYGPDTFKELRAACQSTLAAAQPMPFVDMHDLGDMLVAAGFSTPVMEADTLRLKFGSARALLTEARALGGNPRADRARGLVSGARARALLQALQAQADAQGQIALSFEIVIGHAWKAAPRSATERVIAPPPRPLRK